MSEPYIGEIIAVGFNFGNGFRSGGTWLPCNGQLLAITQYTALFSLIGTIYGGDGRTTFALPNLNGNSSNLPGRIAVSQGQASGLSDYTIGEQVGSLTETLTVNEIPGHTHSLKLGNATAAGATPKPSGSTAAINPNFNGFLPESHINTTLATNAIAYDGDSRPHPNNRPTTELWYCIAVEGQFPLFG